MQDQDMKRIGIFAGAGLLGLALINGVYRAGVNAGLAANGRPGALHDDGGFFPFPLLLIGGIVLFVMWRRGKLGGPGGRGRNGGPGGPNRFFGDWHRPGPEANVPAAATTTEAERPQTTATPTSGPTVV